LARGRGTIPAVNPGLRPAKSTRDEQLLLAGDFLQRAPNASIS